MDQNILEIKAPEHDVECEVMQEKDATTKLPKQEEVVSDLHVETRDTLLREQMLATQLYNQEFSCPEILRQLREDPELAKGTVNVYVTYFNFASMSLNDALRLYLNKLWPEDEPVIQDLLITLFSHWYLLHNNRPSSLQISVYYLSWAIILLNADLHGRHKGKRMTCEEFILNTNSVCHNIRFPLHPTKYSERYLTSIYELVKKKPLTACSVKTENKGEASNLSTDVNLSTVHKTGMLICKRVMDSNRRQTKKGQRAWKPFTAVLKGMVLYLLEGNESDLCKVDEGNALGLHHSVAYPVDHEKRSHVLGLRTADSRLFYFQAETKAKQTLWISMINHIAASYSAPPLASASNVISVHRSQVLPSFPTPLSREEQLRHHVNRIKELSKCLAYLRTRLPFTDPTLQDMEQEWMRYTVYVRALRLKVHLLLTRTSCEQSPCVRLRQVGPSMVQLLTKEHKREMQCT